MGNIYKVENARTVIGMILVGRFRPNSRLAILEVQMQMEEAVSDLVTEVHGQAKVQYVRVWFYYLLPALGSGPSERKNERTLLPLRLSAPNPWR